MYYFARDMSVYWHGTERSVHCVGMVVTSWSAHKFFSAKTLTVAVIVQHAQTPLLVKIIKIINKQEHNLSFKKLKIIFLVHLTQHFQS